MDSRKQTLPICRIHAAKVESAWLCCSDNAICSQHKSTENAPPVGLSLPVARTCAFESQSYSSYVHVKNGNQALSITFIGLKPTAEQARMNIPLQMGNPHLRLPQTSQPPPISKRPATTKMPNCEMGICCKQGKHVPSHVKNAVGPCNMMRSVCDCHDSWACSSGRKQAVIPNEV
jgi:hypothetical protein